MAARAPSGGLPRYTDAAEAAAKAVIGRYSTSFGLATRLLQKPVRRRVRNIYALVRVADEIVDGAAAGAGLNAAAARTVLSELEAETNRAMVCGFSANLVVHAYARTAAVAGFGEELTGPFFASMRMDLDRVTHSQDSFDEYVYGSAEVVGLMCLRAFLIDAPGDSRDPATLALLNDGARKLGSAFQKVNFLRDLADDVRTLGRSYFPGLDTDNFTESDKERILDEIQAELTAAERAMSLLPATSRRAVLSATGIYAELVRRLRATPASQLLAVRVRVPDAVKARIIAGTLLGVREGRR